MKALQSQYFSAAFSMIKETVGSILLLEYEIIENLIRSKQNFLFIFKLPYDLILFGNPKNAKTLLGNFNLQTIHYRCPLTLN